LESFSTMFRVLTQPGEVYARVRDRSPVLWPMVLVGVAGLVSGLMLVPALENMLQEQLVVEPDLPAEAARLVCVSASGRVSPGVLWVLCSPSWSQAESSLSARCLPGAHSPSGGR
jgi:hypothetical protein